MIQINKLTTKIGSIGYGVYAKLKTSRKNETLNIIFTKGKLEIPIETIERINIYDTSLNIVYKDKRTQFINLQNVTYME